MATIRQKKVFDTVVKSGMPITQAMKEAGYALTTANKGGKITSSKGWKELMDTYLPEEKLAQRHRHLLNHKDPKAIASALALAYKIRGSFAPIKHINLNIQANQEQKTKATNAIKSLLDD